MTLVRKFTRENPCTKVDLWNCFRGSSGFRMVPVVEALSLIGANAPVYLLGRQYVTVRSPQPGQVDYYVLTPGGESWLTNGLKRHLELHPLDARRVRHLTKTPTAIKAAPSAVAVVRRRRPAAS